MLCWKYKYQTEDTKRIKKSSLKIESGFQSQIDTKNSPKKNKEIFPFFFRKKKKDRLSFLQRQTFRVNQRWAGFYSNTDLNISPFVPNGKHQRAEGEWEQGKDGPEGGSVGLWEQRGRWGLAKFEKKQGKPPTPTTSCKNGRYLK